MKFIKILAGLLGSLLMLIILSGLALTLFIDPNQYKPEIASYIKQNTGKEMIISSHIHWSLFPHLGVAVDDVLIKDDTRFEGQTFASAKSLIVQAKLGPLLHGNLAVNKIRADDLVINLKHNRTRNNWSVKKSNPVAAEMKTAEKSSPSATKKYININISKIEIDNGTINLLDEQTGEKTTFHHVNLTGKQLTPNTPFPIDMHFNLQKAETTISVAFSSIVHFSDTNQELTLTSLKLAVTPEYKPTINLQTTSMKVNFQDHSLAMPEFKIRFADIDAIGSLSAEDFSGNATWHGSLATNTFDLKALSGSLGNPIATRGTKSLRKVQINGKITARDNDIAIDKLAGTIDNTQLSGRLALRLNPLTLTLNLYANELNLDQYALTATPSVKTTGTVSGNSSSKARVKSTLVVNGDIGIGKLKMDKFELEKVKSTIQFSNHQLTASNIYAVLFSGTTTGSIVANLQGIPTYTVKQSLQGVDMAKMSTTILQKKHLSGFGNIDVNIRSEGNTNRTFMQNLGGTLTAKVTKGALYGFDLDHKLAKASFSLRDMVYKGPADRGLTPFNQLTFVANFNNGLMTNPEITIDSPSVSVDGKGKLNIINHDIDYKIGAKVKNKTQVNGGFFAFDLSEYRIPVTLTGTVEYPKINVDLAEVAKLTVQKQLDRTLKGAIEKGINSPKDLGDAVKRLIPNF